jgi:hypothetical protein
MAIVMKLRWEGVTAEQYDEACRVVDWENAPPDGGVFHVAWFEDGGLNVVDVWDSPEQLDAFVGMRLLPGTTQVGIEGEPKVEVQPAHRVFDARNAVAWS